MAEGGGEQSGWGQSIAQAIADNYVDPKTFWSQDDSVWKNVIAPAMGMSHETLQAGDAQSEQIESQYLGNKQYGAGSWADKFPGLNPDALKAANAAAWVDVSPQQRNEDVTRALSSLLGVGWQGAQAAYRTGEKLMNDPLSRTGTYGLASRLGKHITDEAEDFWGSTKAGLSGLWSAPTAQQAAALGYFGTPGHVSMSVATARDRAKAKGLGTTGRGIGAVLGERGRSDWAAHPGHEKKSFDADEPTPVLGPEDRGHKPRDDGVSDHDPYGHKAAAEAAKARKSSMARAAKARSKAKAKASKSGGGRSRGKGRTTAAPVRGHHRGGGMSSSASAAASGFGTSSRGEFDGGYGDAGMGEGMGGFGGWT